MKPNDTKPNEENQTSLGSKPSNEIAPNSVNWENSELAFLSRDQNYSEQN
jgi:hypothetical protein